jgi:hypothetical protein
MDQTRSTSDQQETTPVTQAGAHQQESKNHSGNRVEQGPEQWEKRLEDGLMQQMAWLEGQLRGEQDDEQRKRLAQAYVLHQQSLAHVYEIER